MCRTEADILFLKLAKIIYQESLHAKLMIPESEREELRLKALFYSISSS